MSTDVVADMLTRMRNAMSAGSISTTCPYSSLKENILKVFKNKKFILDYKVDTSGKFKSLEIIFAPKTILGIKKISKPGQRIYVSADEIKPVMRGYGISIISTSQGVMAGYEAYKKGIGGELICEIY